MQQQVISIESDVDTKNQIENCLFSSNQLFSFAISMVEIVIFTLNSEVTFLNCTFYQNDNWYYLIDINEVNLPQEITNYVISNITVHSCKFTGKKSPALNVYCDFKNTLCTLK